MELEQALDSVVARTNHARYRDLCDESHPDHEYWRREVFRLAGQPVEEPAYVPPLPPIIVQAANLGATIARTVARAARGENLTISEEATQARLAICEACPSKRDDNRCAECGCFIPAAVHVAAKDCPLGKWPSLGG